jgi:hypothetical protein
VRLSRPRVALRGGLLLAGGAYMIATAVRALRSSGEAPPSEGPFLRWIALVEALVAALALAAAAIALLSLRPRRRHHTLRLDDLPPRP